MIAGMSLVSAQAPPQSVEVNATSVSDGGRYEGYRFMDVDGHPLPFQSDEELENYLRTAEVEAVSAIPVGVSRPRKVVFSLDGHRVHAVFKNIDERRRNTRDPTAAGGGRGRVYLMWRDSYIYDLAAYHVDRLLGLDRVPPIVPRKFRGDKGSFQIWLEGTITENSRREKAFEPPEVARFNQQRSTLHVFDNLVANRDSNLGNTLIDGNWRIWFIDCSRCFGTSKDLLYADAITHCDRRLWEALKELDRDEAKAALSPFLTRAEIDALFVRRDKIVGHVQGLIDQWGEDLILFEQRPPTETAPWISR